MIKKIKSILERIAYWFSKEKCYDDMERRGYAAMGLCDGLAGGDWATDYLSFSCIDCPHYCNIKD